MSDHKTHENHSHVHGPNCGHKQVTHGDHVDFLHDGHLHHVHGDHVDEHALDVSAQNPSGCKHGHACASHDATHVHGPSCGHDAIAHGDHTDYVVGGHLHHAHDGHCDDHGPVQVK
ncbi:MAG: hypothetical protein U0174_06310 [Polyangiaceae bacterium]